MKTVFIFILLICLVLSLYGFVFNKGEALNFEQLYKGFLTYVTDIGNAFDGYRDGLIDLIEGNIDVGKFIGELSADIVNGIGQFFIDLWTNIANFFGVCGHIGTECTVNCNCQCKECV